MRIYILVLAILLPILLQAQTESTRKIHDKYDDAFTMFFYKSTLKMVAQDNDEFMEAVKGIEKAKLIRIDKRKGFNETDLQNYVAGIEGEEFEEAISIKQGKNNILVYLKQDDGDPEGIILLMDADDSVSILDVVGFITLDKIGLITKQIEFTEGLNLPRID